MGAPFGEIGPWIESGQGEGGATSLASLWGNYPPRRFGWYRASGGWSSHVVVMARVQWGAWWNVASPKFYQVAVHAMISGSLDPSGRSVSWGSEVVFLGRLGEVCLGEPLWGGTAAP